MRTGSSLSRGFLYVNEGVNVKLGERLNSSEDRLLSCLEGEGDKDVEGLKSGVVILGNNCSFLFVAVNKYSVRLE